MTSDDRRLMRTCALRPQEQDVLYRSSTEVSSSTFHQPNRHVQLWVKLVTPFIKNFF